MKKSYRLRGGKTLAELFSRGRRHDTALFRITFKANKEAHSRYAFIAAKAVDKRSSVRHRLIRRAREWIRKRGGKLPQGFDIAVFLKKEAALAPRETFYEELEGTFSKIFR